VARVVALFCWASGAVLEAVVGPLGISELALWRKLWAALSPGEIVLGDRLFCSFYDIVGVTRRQCDAVFRLHQNRPRDFRQGRRLGKNDRLATWQRPLWGVHPRGMGRREWKALPPTLTVRLIRFAVNRPGFRSKTILVATTLLDPLAYPAHRIAAATARFTRFTRQPCRDIGMVSGTSSERRLSRNSAVGPGIPAVLAWIVPRHSDAPAKRQPHGIAGSLAGVPTDHAWPAVSLRSRLFQGSSAAPAGM